jgi:hypothetical protein
MNYDFILALFADFLFCPEPVVFRGAFRTASFVPQRMRQCGDLISERSIGIAFGSLQGDNLRSFCHFHASYVSYDRLILSATLDEWCV